MGGQIVMRCKVVGKSYGTRVTAVNAAEESRTFEGDYFSIDDADAGFPVGVEGGGSGECAR
jgi:hypothetical protein